MNRRWIACMAGLMCWFTALSPVISRADDQPAGNMGIRDGAYPAPISQAVQTIFITINPSKLFADGSSKCLITALALDDTAKPVAKGTQFSFSTTMGTFQNGSTSAITSTADDTGTISLYLVSGHTIGDAIVTCTVEGVSKSVLIPIYNVQYETETNNDMGEADTMCLDVAFNGQLSSPYDEDWYGLTNDGTSVIYINFVTTAIPKGAGCDGSSTVGTYRVDVRDTDNNVLISYQNIDCSFDNGLWETGIQYKGNYYVVVYCPRLPDKDHYLSTPYYLTVSTSTYPLCGDFNRDGSVDWQDVVDRYASSKEDFPNWFRNCWVADRQYSNGSKDGSFLETSPLRADPSF